MLEEGAAVEDARPRHDLVRLPGGAGDAARRGGHRRGGEGGEGDAPPLRRAHVAARLDGEAARRRPPGPQERRRASTPTTAGRSAWTSRSTRCCRAGAAPPRRSTPREIQERLVFAFLNESVALPAGGDPALAARRRRGGDLRPRASRPSSAGRSATSTTSAPASSLETLERLQRAPRRALPPRADARRHGPGGPQLSCQQDTDPLTRTAGRREARA